MFFEDLNNFKDFLPLLGEEVPILESSSSLYLYFVSTADITHCENIKINRHFIKGDSLYRSLTLLIT